MPPPTPTTTRRPAADILHGWSTRAVVSTGRVSVVSTATSSGSGDRRPRATSSPRLLGAGHQHAGVDLAQRDAHRLLLRVGLDQRADVLQQVVAHLRVVAGDLAGAAGGVDDQRVLGLGRRQQFVDRRMRDALGAGGHSWGCLSTGSRAMTGRTPGCGCSLRYSRRARLSHNCSNSSTAPIRPSSRPRGRTRAAAASSSRARASRCFGDVGRSRSPGPPGGGAVRRRSAARGTRTDASGERPRPVGPREVDLEQHRTARRPAARSTGRTAGPVQVARVLGPLQEPARGERRSRTRRRSRRSRSTPSTSPGRGGLVVVDTDSQTSGRRRSSSAITVPLPTPEGPLTTTSRPRQCGHAEHPRRRSSWRGPSALTVRRPPLIPAATSTRSAVAGPTPGRLSSRSPIVIRAHRRARRRSPRRRVRSPASRAAHRPLHALLTSGPPGRRAATACDLAAVRGRSLGSAVRQAPSVSAS